jgi:hypothetical protein
MDRFVFTAGIGLRSEVRRWLARNGVQFREDKGFLDSQFVVWGSPAVVRFVSSRIRQLALAQAA